MGNKNILQFFFLFWEVYFMANEREKRRVNLKLQKIRKIIRIEKP